MGAQQGFKGISVHQRLQTEILPGTGRWHAEGMTEGVCLAQSPLHQLLRNRSPSPCRGGMAA
jgi:hypothetical protein